MINDKGQIIENPSPRKINKSQLLELQQPGGIDSVNASLRSDAKFFPSDRKDITISKSNDKLSKAQGGKRTEVEENDLELEGGMLDQGTP